MRKQYIGGEGWAKFVVGLGLVVCVHSGAYAQIPTVPGDPTPGTIARVRVGDYVLPDGRSAVDVSANVLQGRGWDILGMTSVVLPRGFVLSPATATAAATVVPYDMVFVDIVLRWPVAKTFGHIVNNSISVPFAPDNTTCLDYDSSKFGVQGPFPGAVCRNGGWSGGT